MSNSRLKSIVGRTESLIYTSLSGPTHVHRYPLCCRSLVGRTRRTGGISEMVPSVTESEWRSIYRLGVDTPALITSTDQWFHVDQTSIYLV
jgi:hypothetical protein